MIAPVIEAIPTRYDGHKFRSRTEARWAVFFRAMGIPYEYEKEGYVLPSGLYLPDFWLPSQEAWVEIKGQAPDEDEKRFASELAAGTYRRVYIFSGNPNWSEDGRYVDAGQVFHPNGDWDNYHMWNECPRCRKALISYSGWRGSGYGCDCAGNYKRDLSPRILAAGLVAREEQFNSAKRTRRQGR